MSRSKISKSESVCTPLTCFTSTGRFVLRMSLLKLHMTDTVILQSLLHTSLADRRALLREHFHAVPGEFGFATSNDGETTEEIQTFLEESVKDGCEGLMVKMLHSEESYYTPSRRSINWLKVCLTSSLNCQAPTHTTLAAQKRLPLWCRRLS